MGLEDVGRTSGQLTRKSLHPSSTERGPLGNGTDSRTTILVAESPPSGHARAKLGCDVLVVPNEVWSSSEGTTNTLGAASTEASFQQLRTQLDYAAGHNEVNSFSSENAVYHTERRHIACSRSSSMSPLSISDSESPSDRCPRLKLRHKEGSDLLQTNGVASKALARRTSAASGRNDSLVTDGYSRNEEKSDGNTSSSSLKSSTTGYRSEGRSRKGNGHAGNHYAQRRNAQRAAACDASRLDAIEHRLQQLLEREEQALQREKNQRDFMKMLEDRERRLAAREHDVREREAEACNPMGHDGLLPFSKQVSPIGCAGGAGESSGIWTEGDVGLLTATPPKSCYGPSEEGSAHDNHRRQLIFSNPSPGTATATPSPHHPYHPACAHHGSKPKLAEDSTAEHNISFPPEPAPAARSPEAQQQSVARRSASRENEESPLANPAPADITASVSSSNIAQAGAILSTIAPDRKPPPRSRVRRVNDRLTELEKRISAQNAVSGEATAEERPIGRLSSLSPKPIPAVVVGGGGVPRSGSSSWSTSPYRSSEKRARAGTRTTDQSERNASKSRPTKEAARAAADSPPTSQRHDACRRASVSTSSTAPLRRQPGPQRPLTGSLPSSPKKSCPTDAGNLYPLFLEFMHSLDGKSEGKAAATRSSSALRKNVPAGDFEHEPVSSRGRQAGSGAPPPTTDALKAERLTKAGPAQLGSARSSSAASGGSGHGHNQSHGQTHNQSRGQTHNQSHGQTASHAVPMQCPASRSSSAGCVQKLGDARRQLAAPAAVQAAFSRSSSIGSAGHNKCDPRQRPSSVDKYIERIVTSGSISKTPRIPLQQRSQHQQTGMRIPSPRRVGRATTPRDASQTYQLKQQTSYAYRRSTSAVSHRSTSCGSRPGVDRMYQPCDPYLRKPWKPGGGRPEQSLYPPSNLRRPNSRSPEPAGRVANRLPRKRDACVPRVFR
ncbi:hypothetical protein DIPPA_28591 [Diplonema papillatum]|nr:hypothetical protein DIPPA_19117 [Diplonema papillatum]KAJ9459808.1 hypothetical protein DIPPA_28591 [Diplonema papillatum]